MIRKNWLWAAALVVFAVGCSKGADESQSASGATTTTGSTGSGTSTTGTTGASASASGYAAVQAILTPNCVGCHGENRPKGGINLTSFDGVMKGGEDGPIVTAGDPDKSKIIDALRGRNGAMAMPKGKPPLAEDQIKAVEDWIKAGAKNG